MPTDKPQTTVYPSSRVWAVCPRSSTYANLALECWARLMTATPLPMLSRQQWCLLADLLNATMVDAGWTAEMLCQEIGDGARLDGLARKWLGDGKTGQIGLRTLLAAVETLDYAGLYATITAVQWYWQHHETVDLNADDWWTIEFRARHAAEAREQA